MKITITFTALGHSSAKENMFKSIEYIRKKYKERNISVDTSLSNINASYDGKQLKSFINWVVLHSNLWKNYEF